MASSGFSQIRLYQNTSSTIPIGVYTDVTNDFLSSADASNVIPDQLYDYDGCNKTISGLSPGTQYWFWVEAIDETGNSSGIQSLGSITTQAPAFSPPPGYTQTNSTLAYKIRGVPDGGSSLTEININPAYFFRAIYSCSRDGSSGNYTFSGPGINVSSGGETTSGTNVTGAWVSGSASYSYSSSINDFIGSVRFEVTTTP